MLAILALLGALLAPRVTGALEASRQARMEQDLTLLLSAGQLYEKGQSAPLTSVDQLVEAGLLDQAPDSPVRGYTYNIQSTDQGLTVALIGEEGIYEKNGYQAQKTADGFYPG